jgi:hypothetical protein
MTDAAKAVMAVVHVEAPPEVDPHAIEAELTRAISTNRKRPMTAEFALAGEARDRPRGGQQRGQRRHGFVGILSFRGPQPPKDLQHRVQKLARKALRRRFGRQVSAEVKTE